MKRKLEKTIKTGSGQRSKETESRRRILASTIVASGAIVSQWHKPIVQAVVLPAHAATTSVDGGEGEGEEERDASPSYYRQLFTNVTSMINESNGNQIAHSVLDYITAPAVAGFPQNFTAAMCILDSDAVLNVTYIEERLDNETTLWSGSGMLGENIELEAGECSGLESDTYTVQISAQSKDSISFQFVGSRIPSNAGPGGYSGLVEVDAGSCAMFTEFCR
ncbi:MAG: hypothetical protein AAF353_01450 [Pseudomonadota bacterium]